MAEAQVLKEKGNAVRLVCIIVVMSNYSVHASVSVILASVMYWGGGGQSALHLLWVFQVHALYLCDISL